MATLAKNGEYDADGAKAVGALREAVVRGHDLEPELRPQAMDNA
jgi:hypothetical protein